MTSKTTIALVSCTATKLEHPAAARDLYVSPWFTLPGDAGRLRPRHAPAVVLVRCLQPARIGQQLRWLGQQVAAEAKGDAEATTAARLNACSPVELAAAIDDLVREQPYGFVRRVLAELAGKTPGSAAHADLALVLDGEMVAELEDSK